MTDRPLSPKEKPEFTSPPYVRLDHGWITDYGYICDGCAVRSPHEHRCHHADGTLPCECDMCTIECEARGCEATAYFDRADGWYFGMPHPSDGIGVTLCPEHSKDADA